MRFLLLLAIFFVRTAAGDTVTIAPAAADGASFQVVGTIVDYRGDRILIERANGSQRTFPSLRVRNIKTTWPEAYDPARRSMQKRAWATAIAQLDAAARSEQRIWARRLILTDLMRSQMAAGRWEAAGELMILLNRSDPATPAWGEAPLAWFTAEYVRPATAERWLADTNPAAARLLGASWLLATPQRGQAQTVLNSLANNGSPPIAGLAVAQLWRLSSNRVRENQIASWRQHLKKLPAELRAGPQHVLAQAYYRLARYDEAALVALESPLAGAAPRELSARGLVLAGQAVAKSGHAEEARRLWSEVRDDYADTRQHADVVSLLNGLK